MEERSFWTKIGEWSAQLSKIGGGLVILLAGLAFISDNRGLRSKIADMAGTPELIIQMSALNDNVRNLLDNNSLIANKVTHLEEKIMEADENGLGGRAPALKFLENGMYVTDARIGENVTFKTRYVKLRDCGRPKITAWFKNGRKIPHTFRNISAVGADGRPAARKADPQEVIDGGFTAWIPTDDAVTPGSAIAWIEVGSYEFCPNVATVSSAPIPFNILDGNDNPVNRVLQIEKNKDK